LVQSKKQIPFSSVFSCSRANDVRFAIHFGNSSLGFDPLIAPEMLRISVRLPGATGAQMLTITQSPNFDGPWMNLVGAIAEAGDNGIFAAVVNPSGHPQLFWRALRH
jgi:hypothetical protein